MREGMLNVMQSEFITAARQVWKRNNATFETRGAHRDIAGSFLLRSDARGFVDRVILSSRAFSRFRAWEDRS